MSAGSELVIGPWSHSGFLDNRVGHSRSGHRSKFNHLTHTLTFFDRCCGRHTPDQALAEVAAHEAGASHALSNGGVSPLLHVQLTGDLKTLCSTQPCRLSACLTYRAVNAADWHVVVHMGAAVRTCTL